MTEESVELPEPAPDVLCGVHGRPLHGFVHEAGHAVVAALHGYSYVSVSVPFELGEVDEKFGDIVGGGLNFGDVMPESWVPGEPTKALEFLLAGRVAEDFLLGDTLWDSHLGDMKVWGWGMRGHPDIVAGGDHREVSAAALGAPISDILAGTEVLIHTHRAQVALVARALHDAEGWSLTNEEVLALL